MTDYPLYDPIESLADHLERVVLGEIVDDDWHDIDAEAEAKTSIEPVSLRPPCRRDVVDVDSMAPGCDPQQEIPQ